MSWLTLHLASGAGLFSGSAALLGGLALAMLRRCRARVLAWVVACGGVILVALSATPLPWWAYAAWAAAAIAAMAALTWRPRTRTAVVLAAAAAAVTLGVAAAEGRHHVTPEIPPVAQRRLYVVGDSLSAGVEAE